MVILMSQQRWHRRDSKRASQRKFKSDNRKSIGTILNILIDKAKKIKEKGKNSA